MVSVVQLLLSIVMQISIQGGCFQYSYYQYVMVVVWLGVVDIGVVWLNVVLLGVV